MFQQTLIFLYVTSKFLLSFAGQNATERDLVSDLFYGYDHGVRPVKNPAKAVYVAINPAIYSLIEVNEKQETVTFFQWLPMKWTDEFLTWNPLDYNNITRFSIRAISLWVPDIIIFNSFTTDAQGIPIESLMAEVEYNGKVILVRHEIITARCKFNVLRFPYDVQNCSLQMGSWAMQIWQLRVVNLAQKFKPKLYRENSEWELFDISSETVQANYSWGFDGEDRREFEEVYYHVALKRKPIHYILVMVLPSCIITSLCILGLFSPFSSNGERQEKVTLGLTNLLTMAVMLQLVADSLPKSADGMPLLGKYILFEFSFSSFCTFLTVVIMNVHQRALSLGWTAPEWLRRVTFTHVNQEQKRKPIKLVNTKRFFSTDESGQQIFTSAIACLEACDSLKNLLLEDKKEKSRAQTWDLIFDKIDLILLFLCMTLNCVVTAGFFS